VERRAVADPTKKKVKAVRNVEVDRVLYTSGSEFELDKERADAAIKAGHVEPVNKSGSSAGKKGD
jgi:lipopolysaccharide assembly outer membrane protein LptD (OstA)